MDGGKDDRTKPERRVALLWHDIVMQMERRRMLATAVFSSVASFAMGIVVGALLL